MRHYEDPPDIELWETYLDMEREHIEVNQADLEYQISLIDDEIGQIFAINYGSSTQARIRTGLLIVEAIERQILEEVTYRAKQRAEK